MEVDCSYHMDIFCKGCFVTLYLNHYVMISWGKDGTLPLPLEPMSVAAVYLLRRWYLFIYFLLFYFEAQNSALFCMIQLLRSYL